MWVVVVVFLVVFGYYRYKEKAAFQEAGSRFTGEDAIWLINNSNIVLNPEAKIPGVPTPFRSFINRQQ